MARQGSQILEPKSSFSGNLLAIPGTSAGHRRKPPGSSRWSHSSSGTPFPRAFASNGMVGPMKQAGLIALKICSFALGQMNQYIQAGRPVLPMETWSQLPMFRRLKAPTIFGPIVTSCSYVELSHDEGSCKFLISNL